MGVGRTKQAKTWNRRSSETRWRGRMPVSRAGETSSDGTATTFSKQHRDRFDLHSEAPTCSLPYAGLSRDQALRREGSELLTGVHVQRLLQKHGAELQKHNTRRHGCGERSRTSSWLAHFKVCDSKERRKDLGRHPECGAKARAPPPPAAKRQPLGPRGPWCNGAQRRHPAVPQPTRAFSDGSFKKLGDAPSLHAKNAL